MKKTFVYNALVLATFISSAANAQPIWETSSKWFCRGEVMTICKKDGVCSKLDSRLSIRIDFQKNTIENLSAGTVYPISRKEQFEDKSYFTASATNTYAIVPSVSDGITTYDFIDTIAFGNVISHFGSCNAVP